MNTDLERRLLRLVCLREECGFRCRSISPACHILFLFSCCELVWQFVMDLFANGTNRKSRISSAKFSMDYSCLNRQDDSARHLLEEFDNLAFETVRTMNRSWM